MAKRRKVAPVALTGEPHEQLERLWFYFGNYGPKTTPGNHSFIQRLLENGIDERPLHNKRTPKSELPTPDCEAAVEAVLAMASALQSWVSNGELRVVSIPEDRPRTSPNPEMKAVFDDMKRRYSVVRGRIKDVDDTQSYEVRYCLHSKYRGQNIFAILLRTGSFYGLALS